MIKYKLLKRYPGLTPELQPGDIVYFEKDGSLIDAYNKDKSIHYFAGLSKNIENYPDFWQKIEKSYQVLTFVRKGGKFNGEKFRLQDDGKYRVSWTNGVTISESYGLESEGHDVHSIKRLSDGTVFTVGDRFTGTVADLETDQGYVEISYIEINEDTNVPNFGIKYRGITSDSQFEELEKISTDAIITKDGEVISEPGEPFWEVKGHFTYVVKNKFGHYHPSKYELSEHLFATEENAREFMESRKKKFSELDVSIAMAKSTALKPNDSIPKGFILINRDNFWEDLKDD